MDNHTQANQNTLSFDKNDTAVCKGIAIILLLFHHLCGSATYFSESFLGITDEFVVNTIIDAAQDARVCVWIFAFLSAYGLSSKYYKLKDKITVSTFLYKQWFSLMKSFWFVYICVFTFYFFIAKISALEYYGGNVLVALLDFFGAADIFETKMLSGVWWYMCFAQILLLIIPVITLLVDYFGLSSIIISWIAVQFFGPGFRSNYGGIYFNYLYAILFAVLCSKYHFFERVPKKSSFAFLRPVLLLVIFIGSTVLRNILYDTVLYRLATMVVAVAPIALCIFVQRYIRWKPIRFPLMFLGKHSGNMFMIHGIIYGFFPSLVFFSHNVVLSVVTLLMVSLLVSIIIELLKKILHYDSFIARFSDYILLKIVGVGNSLPHV